MSVGVRSSERPRPGWGGAHGPQTTSRFGPPIGGTDGSCLVGRADAGCMSSQHLQQE